MPFGLHRLCGRGIATDKGKIAISMAKSLGSPTESSVLGVGDRVSCANAAMANGELINALDYDRTSPIFILLRPLPPLPWRRAQEPLERI